MTTFRTIVVATQLSCVLLLYSAPARTAETRTYPDLVNCMTDLSRLAVLPEAGEKCAQWSSYDRTSRYDEKAGEYVAWGANGDGAGFICKEGGQIVMAEMDGPGCVWRAWSAAAAKGHVKIYLDGQETPAVNLPFDRYFSGDTAPFNYPALSYNLGHTMQIGELTCFNGQNLYLPIPYQKSCKIVADEKWGAYYQFNYSTFPKGTMVPTFSMSLAAKNAAALQKANDFFANNLGDDPAGSRPGQETLRKTVTLAPGQTVQVAALAGPRAITALRVHMKLGDRRQQMTALRKLALQITWDGQARPAVWCPLGDFFGTAPGENLYKSLPAGMTKDGYYSYWYMPFAKSAAIELINGDASPKTVDMEAVHVPLTRSFDGLGHFHAKWHRDMQPLPKDRWPDWMLVRTQGRGRFCGAMLHVWNPRGGWWGEGDEKFFVDGEKFPSTFGTGTEDYFGYAWGYPGLFERPYHCQTMTQNNAGHQSLLRWHIPDNVPFHKAFEGVMEKYDHTGPAVRYACTAFWYLSPDGIDVHEPVPAANRDGYYDDPPLVIAGIEIVGPVLDGTLSAQNMSSIKTGQWHDNDQLLWCSWNAGRKLSVRIPVKSAGAYRVDLGLTRGPTYGTVQFYLDGQQAGQPVNLQNTRDTIVAPFSLGVHNLTAGDHILTIEMLGTDKEKEMAASHLFGLDYVTCNPFTASVPRVTAENWLPVIDPLLRSLDLNVGESCKVTLANGNEVVVKLVDLSETRDDLRQAVRRTGVTVEINGRKATLTASNGLVGGEQY